MAIGFGSHRLTKLRRVIAILAFVSLASAVATGQTASRTPAKCDVDEIADPGGWKVPGIASAVVTSGKSRVTTDHGDVVDAEMMRPRSPEAVLTLVTCTPGKPKRLLLRSQAVKVVEIQRFTVNSRVFAYRVTAQLLVGDGKNRHIPVASEFMVTFYDEEGLGRFTVMQYPGPGLIPRFLVPEWVKSGMR